ncbi:MAG: extracellular solute-binding protein [Clostridia bacterium]|nr:extracellular solute-binding protein [Clostridia bacterium]
MKKRLISLLACGVLTASAVAGLTACGDGGIKLTVWGSATQQETLKQMVEEFKAANPDTKYNIEVGVGEEDMAASNVTKAPSAAADVYCYSNDQLINLLKLGALSRLGGDYLDFVKTNNSEESVASGSIAYGTDDEKVYGYPYAADNGYFMYYDKSVLTEEQVGSLETIISVCEGAGKKIHWALDVPWYVAGWFFTFGGEYKVEYDYSNNYTETKVEVNFNENGGILASKAMAMLAGSSSFAGKGTDDEKILTGFATHNTAVAVSGTWNAKAIKERLGDNYGVCELPTVTVDGTTKHLYSFKGYKLMGVNPNTKYAAEAHKLAQFLTSEANQQARYEKHQIGPTNKTVANSDAVKGDITLNVLNSQNEYALEQVSVPTNFWEPLKGYGLNIIDKLIDEKGSSGEKFTYQNYLNSMVASIKGNK